MSQLTTMCVMGQLSSLGRLGVGRARHRVHEIRPGHRHRFSFTRIILFARRAEHLGGFRTYALGTRAQVGPVLRLVVVGPVIGNAATSNRTSSPSNPSPFEILPAFVATTTSCARRQACRAVHPWLVERSFALVGFPAPHFGFLSVSPLQHVAVDVRYTSPTTSFYLHR